MKQALALAALLAAAVPAQAQIYKCVENGRQIYSDQPCPSGGGEVLKHVRRHPESKFAREDRERREQFVRSNPDLDEATKAAVLTGRIFVGMSGAAATASWGDFRRENRSHYSSGLHIQWVYHYFAAPGTQKYVYVTNGVVTAIQE